MEELLENKIKLFEKIDIESLKILRGNFLKILKLQKGSRILQNTLSNNSYMITKIIMNEIEDHLSDLIIDPYANYFCQRLYEFLKLEDRLIFLRKVILFFNLIFKKFLDKWKNKNNCN